eukprot:11824934-Prorocentrum_lima.AAC.1
MFTDGAAFWPQLGFRRQAGWAVVQIDLEGKAVQSWWARGHSKQQEMGKTGLLFSWQGKVLNPG